MRILFEVDKLRQYVLDNVLIPFFFFRDSILFIDYNEMHSELQFHNVIICVCKSCVLGIFGLEIVWRRGCDKRRVHNLC